MNRKNFIKKSLIGLAAGVGLTLVGKAKEVKPYKSGSDIGESYSYPSDNPNDYVEISEDLFERLLKGNKPIGSARIELTRVHFIPNGATILGCYFTKHPNGGFVYDSSPKNITLCDNYVNYLAGHHSNWMFCLAAPLG